MRNSIIKILMLPLLMVLCSCALNKETTGEYIDDTAITSKVMYDLTRKLETKVSGIHVETFKRTVQLSGFVTDYNVAARAEEIASKVKGVGSVKNNIQVKNSSKEPSHSKDVSAVISDTKITADIKQRLLRDKSTSSQSVHVTTHNQVVTLSGTVKSHKEAATAEKVAKKTPGVKKVINKLVF